MIFHLYGFFMGLAITAGYFLVVKRAEKYHFPKEEITSLFLFIIPLGILGARIYHVADQWEYYVKRPIEILALWKGGLGIWGAIIGGIIGIYLFVFFLNKRTKLFYSAATILELIVPSLVLGQAIGRIGNFFNQEAFGPPTNLPWGVYIKMENRPDFWQGFSYFQPTFFYESLWMILGFGILILWERRKQNLCAFYLIWYGLGRFLLEFIRFGTARFLGINVAQTFSILGIILGFAILTKRFKIY